MATQNFKRNLLLILYREGKNIASLFPPAAWEIKISDTCRLFPPFGDPSPSCLLPSQQYTALTYSFSNLEPVLLKDLSYSILLTEKLHFVRFREESLKIPWPHPTTHEPIGPQTRISWLNIQEFVVYLGNRDQSKTNTQPFERKWPIRYPLT